MKATAGPRRRMCHLPEPERAPVSYTIISVDDHVVEPAHLFVGRLPQSLAAEAPRVVEDDAGSQHWEFDGARYSQIGLNAVAGMKRSDVGMEPIRFDEMRRGCWDVAARIADMDINGVWASLNFPSQITGFCGRNYSACSNRPLGIALTRAWNDWIFEEWYSVFPDRIIPQGITYLADPVIAAEEIRRNAARGFRAVTLPERPHRLGYPSIFTDYWDPIFDACVETSTVVNLHVGSSGQDEVPVGAPALALAATTFSQLSLTAATEWLWSAVPVRFPTLRIALSEGGIGWVAMLLDRLKNLVARSGYGDLGWDIEPAEVLRRNFWFCTLDDPSTIDTYSTIGVDRIMVEVDYPHGDSTWPRTQEVVAQAWGHLPHKDLHLMTHANAADLYRHPLPQPCLDGAS